MHFCNRQGERIDGTMWARLTRDRRYTNILTTGLGNHEVRVAWVGIACVCEERPRLFVVEVIQLLAAEDKGVHRRRPDVRWPDQWWSTEHEALRCHDQIERELRTLYSGSAAASPTRR